MGLLIEHEAWMAVKELDLSCIVLKFACHLEAVKVAPYLLLFLEFSSILSHATPAMPVNLFLMAYSLSWMMVF